MSGYFQIFMINEKKIMKKKPYCLLIIRKPDFLFKTL